MGVGRWAFVLALVIACATVTAAQQYEHPLPADFNEPVRLYKTGLGTFARPISSKNPDTQAYFTQGFQLMYGFAKVEAGRSFREAQKRDPNCAICYWGEAWAWGPYVNGRMTAAHAARAYAAIQKALALADRHADAKEQTLIRAMGVRYVERFDPATRADQDRAYADAMARVAATYPDDLDVATLYGEALFLLLPRPRAFPIDDPTVSHVLTVLEGALTRDAHHPGACHLYIHMTELTPEPQRAAACAEHLGGSIPGASHINHMPAHVWTRVGRWGDAVRASLQAWQSDQKGAKGGDAFATYPAHDLHMLTFAAAMDGQSSVALQAARGFARLTSDPMLHALTIVRFGRFDEAANLGQRPADEVAAGMWEFARGYAALRRGDAAAARTSLDRLQSAERSSTSTFRIHPAKSLLAIVAAILEGEIALTANNAAAITAFERAVSLQDGLLVDDPEPFPFAARHWLGAALLLAKRPADAERVYREDLVRHPHNGWALVGLQQALRDQGKETRAIDEELRSSWSRADIQIRASRF